MRLLSPPRLRARSRPRRRPRARPPARLEVLTRPAASRRAADAPAAAADDGQPQAPRSRRSPAVGPPFVGLTGGLGAGKSTALDAVLQVLGRGGLSTPTAIVHELVRRRRPCSRGGARAASATEVFDASEQVDRRGTRASGAFAHDVPSAPGSRGLLWPRVAEPPHRGAPHSERARLKPRPRRSRSIVEVPLLFEAGGDRPGFAATIAVVADDELPRGARRRHATWRSLRSARRASCPRPRRRGARRTSW